LELDKTNVQALINRGWAKHLLGQTDAALQDLNAALTLDGEDVIGLLNRSAVLLELKQFVEAEADLARAEAVDAEHPGVWLNRGELLWQQRQFAAAKQAYEKSWQLAPELAEGQNGLAWFYATCPEDNLRDADAALRLASAATKASEQKDWSHLDTLAAAYANAGRFPEAVRTAEAALKLAPEAKQAEVQQRLEGYRAERAFRW
jgi:tetratricopeptide (TPR) repeat protein